MTAAVLLKVIAALWCLKSLATLIAQLLQLAKKQKSAHL
jgi:hypothetical protein